MKLHQASTLKIWHGFDTQFEQIEWFILYRSRQKLLIFGHKKWSIKDAKGQIYNGLNFMWLGELTTRKISYFIHKVCTLLSMLFH